MIPKPLEDEISRYALANFSRDYSAAYHGGMHTYDVIQHQLSSLKSLLRECNGIVEYSKDKPVTALDGKEIELLYTSIRTAISEINKLMQ